MTRFVPSNLVRLWIFVVASQLMFGCEHPARFDRSGEIGWRSEEVSIQIADRIYDPTYRSQHEYRYPWIAGDLTRAGLAGVRFRWGVIDLIESASLTKAEKQSVVITLLASHQPDVRYSAYRALIQLVGRSHEITPVMTLDDLLHCNQEEIRERARVLRRILMQS